jgi:hypothetical protein
MIASDLLPIQFWTEGTLTYNQELSYRLDHEKFILKWFEDTNIKFQFRHATGANLVVRVCNRDEEVLVTLPLVEVSDTVYELDLVPSNEGLSGEIYFEGSIDLGGGNYSRQLLSDAIEIIDSEEGLVLISANNSVEDNPGVEFDSIVFGGTTIFNFYFPGRFYFPGAVEETESDNISTGEIVELTGAVKKQRLLEIHFVPFYSHVKLMLLLKLHYKLIDGFTWKQDNNKYPMPEPDNFSMAAAKVWLTKQGSIVRNVYNAPNVNVLPSSAMFVVGETEDICAGDLVELWWIGELTVGTLLYNEEGLETLVEGNFIRQDGSSEIRILESGVLGEVTSECGEEGAISASVILAETEEAICANGPTTVYYEGALVEGTQLFSDLALTTPVSGDFEFIILPGESPTYRSLVLGEIGAELADCVEEDEYTISAVGNFAVPSADWDCEYEHTIGVRTLTITVADPNDAGTLGNDGSGSVTMRAKKQNNGGLAQDAGTVLFKKNGVTIDTQNFIVSANVSNLTYVMTGLSGTEELEIEITEG